MIDVSNSQPLGSDPVALVAGVLAEDDSAVERLFSLYRRGLTGYFAHQFGYQDAEDLVTETLRTVWQEVRAGSLREPERLAGFVIAIARRIGYRVIEERTHSRRWESQIDQVPAVFDRLQTAAESLEDSLCKAQQRGVMLRVLRAMSGRERKALHRFYVLEQTTEQIQREMGMTETQFRLTKRRAQSRFGELGKMQLRPPVSRLSAQSEKTSIARASCS